MSDAVGGDGDSRACDGFRTLRVDVAVTGSRLADGTVMHGRGGVRRTVRDGVRMPQEVAMSTAQSRSMSRRLRLTFVGALLAASAFGGCLGGSERDDVDDRDEKAERPVSSERPAERSRELRLVELEPLNGSGVRAVARLLLDGRRLAVDAIASGATPAQAHMQHIHLPDGHAEGRCPTRKLDADGDGLVSLEESVSAYGAPAVSLEPFPLSEGPDWEYEQTLTVPKGVELDRGVVVLHGMPVRGRYDELMPIACGVVDEDAVTREVALEPVNNSVIAGTARLALSGSRMYAWVSLGGIHRGPAAHAAHPRAGGQRPRQLPDA